MRLKRDYAGAAKRLGSWAVSRFKPLSVHTEAIFLDSVWKKIQEKVVAGKVHTWHVMTPANYDLYKSSFNVKMSKQRLSKLMKERYLWMKKRGQRIHLHIHLSLLMNNITYKEQEQLFVESLSWMKKELDIVPTEFVPGWWSYNKDTEKLCKKYHLKLIKEHDYDYTHDYHWWL